MRSSEQNALGGDWLKNSMIPESARRLGRIRSRALILASALAVLSSCIGMGNLTSRTAPSPDFPWTPPASHGTPAVAPLPAQIPAELIPSRQNWTLADLVNIGLLNNIQTHAAWAAARSASAGVDIARSAYFPDVSLSVTGTKTKGSALGGRFVFDYSSLGPTASIDYLLLDLGGRNAVADEARQALAAANWTQNFVIQNVILQVEQNYYLYLTARALLEAYSVSLKEAETNLDAATVRHDAGVATIAELLQAKTAFSQAELNMVSTQGLVQTYKATLANSIGLAANTGFEVADALPASLPLDRVSGEVDRYIAQAQAARPDLVAARSQVLQAQARIRAVRSDGWPSLIAAGSIGKLYYLHNPTPSNNYTFSVTLNIPVSGGIANQYRVLQAAADADAATAQMEGLEQASTVQVWISYFNLKTAAQRITTAQALYDSAEESHRVAFGRYKEGVGSILDLLAAQTALENGRVQLIQAKADWLTSLVQFAHDTGTLDKPDKTLPGIIPTPAKKGDHRP